MERQEERWKDREEMKDSERDEEIERRGLM